MAKRTANISVIDNKIDAAKERLEKLLEQKQMLIAQEKTFTAIGQIICEQLDCSYDMISLDALRDYIESHIEDMRIISQGHRDDNNAHEDNSEENYL